MPTLKTDFPNIYLKFLLTTAHTTLIIAFSCLNESPMSKFCKFMATAADISIVTLMSGF